MGRQYKRVYELTIIQTTGETRIISGLKLKFIITKSSLSYPNLAQLTITNPNQLTIAALQNKFTTIVFNAGYEGNIKLLFKGEIRNSYIGRTNTETTITIYAGDGQRGWENSTFNKTYSENVLVSTAIKDIMSTFEQITTGVLEGLPDVADKLLGQTLSGSSKDLLDNYAKEYSFTWSIQDGEIITTPLESPLLNNQAVLVTSATGMIGTPTLTQVSIGSSTNRLGVEVTTLLNPQLVPNAAFKIESTPANLQLGNLYFKEVKQTSAEGTYKVQEVTYKGDSREGQWLSSVKGISING